jgi:hypothetical protein
MPEILIEALNRQKKSLTSLNRRKKVVGELLWLSRSVSSRLAYVLLLSSSASRSSLLLLLRSVLTPVRSDSNSGCGRFHVLFGFVWVDLVFLGCVEFLISFWCELFLGFVQ